MKISLEWLNQYLDRPATADEVEQLMTDQGMPIETRLAVPGGDFMLDVEVTSNRSDCLSHVGVAREVSAGSGRAIKLPPSDITTTQGEAVESLTSVQVQRPDLCPVYTARVIRGVKVGPSPAWLSRRLEAIGLRSVSNVVDVTNYVLFEMGQPLHAFDLARLNGKRILVRTASAGEEFAAIDGSKHKLTGEMLVIADAQKPVAIAGVMGGLQSEVGSGTTDILLESAIFDSLSVRRTSRALKLASDSSYRFERGLDPRGVELASRRAARLIVELAGGTIASGVIRVGVAEPALKSVSMRLARCRAILGLDLADAAVIQLLTRLGLSPRFDAGGAAVQCTVPSHRLDLEREIDVIEEVARLHGLDRVPVRDRLSIVVRPPQPVVMARKRIGQVLAALGYHEAITFSFLKPAIGERFLPQGHVAVMTDDERRKAEPMLRPSLLPSLLLCRKANQDVGNSGVRLFETASTWSRGADGAIIERRRLSLIADVAEGEKAGDALRQLRGAVEELLSALAGEVAVEFKPVAHGCMSVAAEVLLDGSAVGVIGLIDTKVQKVVDVQTSIVAAEFELDALLAAYPPKQSARQLARFPGIERDLSVVVGDAVSWHQIRDQIAAAQPALMEGLRFLVTYRGKPIAAGKKSVSFRMTFRDPSATLRSEQADGQVNAIVDRLKAQLGAELRA